MKQAIFELVSDFLSALLFLAVYLVTGNVALAAGVAIVAGLVQIALLKRAGRRVEPMQWASLGLVLVLGGASILTQSPRFVMVKPSLAHFAIAAVMLRRGWMSRYLPEVVRHNLPEPVIIVAGYAWAALLAVLGVANLILALWANVATWAWFVSVVAVGAKVAAFGLQVVVFRTMVRRRRLGQGLNPLPG